MDVVLKLPFLDVAKVWVEASIEVGLSCIAFPMQQFTELVTMDPSLDCVESFQRLANQVGYVIVQSPQGRLLEYKL